MYRLIFKKNGKKVAEGTVGESAVSVGRSPDSAVFLDDPSVSPEHSTFSKLGDKLLVEDAGSASGTFVNGRKMSTGFIEPGDKISIGIFTAEVASDQFSDDATIAEIEEKRPSAAIPKNEALKDWLAGSVLEDKAAAKVTNEEKTEIASPEEISGTAGGREKRTMRFRPQEEVTVLDTNVKKTTGKPLSPDARTVSRKVEETGKTVMMKLESAPRLYVNDPEKGEVTFLIENEESIVGRGQDSDLCINHPSISLRHAVLVNDREKVTLIDQKSTNGTKVNGEETRERVLKCHDLVEFGEIKAEYVDGAVLPIGFEREKMNFEGETNAPILKDRYGHQEGEKFPLGALMKSKRFRFYAVMAVLVLLGLIVPKYLKKSGEQPPQTMNPRNVEDRMGRTDAESERIILHNLSLARRFVSEKKFEEAKRTLNIILDNVDPKNFEALELLSQIDAIARAAEEKAKEEEREKKERERQVTELISGGKESISKNRLSEAKEKFENVLSVDPANSEAPKYLIKISELQARTSREKEILKKKMKEIEASYYQGVSFFEEGNYDAAAEVLRKVAEYRSTEFYNSAVSMLSEIDKKQMGSIEEQLLEVDTLIKSEELLKAENIIKGVLRRYPENEKAKTLYDRVHVQLVEKAKKIYGEGIVYEDVVEDVNSARESYEEVLRLLPNSNEEYNRKAKERLNRLK